MSLHAVPVLGAFHVTLTDIYLEGLDVEEAKTGLVLGPDGAFILLVEDLQVPHFYTTPTDTAPCDPIVENVQLAEHGRHNATVTFVGCVMAAAGPVFGSAGTCDQAKSAP